MKQKFCMLLMLGYAMVTSGCISLKYGVSPNTNALNSLHVGESSKSEVLLALGEPRGSGKTSSYSDMNPRDIWFYEYVEAGMSGARIEILLVFMEHDLYDGHLHFSSFDEYKTEAGTDIVGKSIGRSEDDFAPVLKIESDLVHGKSLESEVLAILGKPTGSGSALIPPGHNPQDILYYESIEGGDVRNAPDGVMEIDIQQRILLIFLQEGVFDGFLWYFNDASGSQFKMQ